MIYKIVESMPELEFSAIGMGTWAVGGGSVWNNANDQDNMATIKAAIDLGVTYFDTAPVYGLGHSETVLGQAIVGQRDNIIIGSKCGLVWDKQNRVSNNLTAESLAQEVDSSLKRLNTDYIDLYQLHWPDPNTPLEETAKGLQKLLESGKIRHIGVSNYSVKDALKLHEMVPVASFQGLYNLLERNAESYHGIPLDYRVEREVFPLCEQYGWAFFPYSPLMQGLLTGTFKAEGNFDEKDVRASNPKLNGELFKEYYQKACQLGEIANGLNCSLAQLSLAWLIKQNPVTSIISGALTPVEMNTNAAACDLVLNEETVRRIELIVSE